MSSTNSTGLTTHEMSLSRKRSMYLPLEPSSKRLKTSRPPSSDAFSCFALDGTDVNLHRRSVFSPKRRAEVNGIRRKGACLRCRLLKRAVSNRLCAVLPSTYRRDSVLEKILVERAWR